MPMTRLKKAPHHAQTSQHDEDDDSQSSNAPEREGDEGKRRRKPQHYFWAPKRFGLRISRYSRELVPIAGSPLAALLMGQLEYWFEKYPGGFWKFQMPAPDHPAYKKGDSWTEEMGFTKNEFRTAFSRIGIVHKSKSIFQSFDEPFWDDDAGVARPYCAYINRLSRQTWYVRNHPLLDDLFGPHEEHDEEDEDDE